jgi:hypothetical protein
MTSGNGWRRCCHRPRPGGVAAGVATGRFSTASCFGSAAASLAGSARALRALGDSLQALGALAGRRDPGTDQASLHTQAEAAGELDSDAQIDSTVVRAHQHAAGARKGEHFDPGKAPASARPVTGGLTTKLHTICDG